MTVVRPLMNLKKMRGSINQSINQIWLSVLQYFDYSYASESEYEYLDF